MHYTVYIEWQWYDAGGDADTNKKKWTRKLFHVENANLIGDAVISHHLVLPFIFFGITFKHDIYLQTILESLRKCEQWLVWKGHRWFVRPSWQGRRNRGPSGGQEAPKPFYFWSWYKQDLPSLIFMSEKDEDCSWVKEATDNCLLEKEAEEKFHDWKKLMRLFMSEKIWWGQKMF